jgi:hypothetical protein
MSSLNGDDTNAVSAMAGRAIPNAPQNMATTIIAFIILISFLFFSRLHTA